MLKFFISLLNITALVAIICSAGCENDEPSKMSVTTTGQGLVGGSPTAASEFTGVVGTILDNGLCTATFIHPEVLLTAGHCVYSTKSGRDAVSNPGALEILGGIDVLAPSARVFPKAVEVLLHPGWDGKLSLDDVDLALIHLATPVDNVNIHGIRSQPSIDIGETGLLVGYGMTSATNGSSAGIQRSGDSTVLDIEYAFIEVGDPASTCTGDSGGPFFTDHDSDGKLEVSGVTSAGRSAECYSDKGGFEIDVQAQRNWIFDTVKDLTGDDIEKPAGGYGDADTDADADGDADGGGDEDNTDDGGPNYNRDSNSSCMHVTPGNNQMWPLYSFLLLI